MICFKSKESSFRLGSDGSPGNYGEIGESDEGCEVSIGIGRLVV